MNDTLNRSHAVGDIVTPDPAAGWPRRLFGTRFVITKTPVGARGVNYLAVPCDADGNAVPGGRGLKGPAESLLKVDGTTPEAVSTAIADAFVVAPPVGSIVKSAGGVIPAGFYTVIGQTDATRVRIVPIGDTSGRYYRAPNGSVTVLDAGAVLAALDLV